LLIYYVVLCTVFVCFVIYSGADRPKSNISGSDPVAWPTGCETLHWAGRRCTASDTATAGRPVRVLPHTCTSVEQAARLPNTFPSGHLAIH